MPDWRALPMTIFISFLQHNSFAQLLTAHIKRHLCIRKVGSIKLLKDNKYENSIFQPKCSQTNYKI